MTQSHAGMRWAAVCGLREPPPPPPAHRGGASWPLEPPCSLVLGVTGSLCHGSLPPRSLGSHDCTVIAISEAVKHDYLLLQPAAHIGGMKIHHDSGKRFHYITYPPNLTMIMKLLHIGLST